MSLSPRYEVDRKQTQDGARYGPPRLYLVATGWGLWLFFTYLSLTIVYLLDAKHDEGDERLAAYTKAIRGGRFDR